MKNISSSMISNYAINHIKTEESDDVVILHDKDLNEIAKQDRDYPPIKLLTFIAVSILILKKIVIFSVAIALLYAIANSL